MTVAPGFSAPDPGDRIGQTPAIDLQLINLDDATETRTCEKGRFELYRVGPMTLGRASLHVMGSEGYASAS